MSQPQKLITNNSLLSENDTWLLNNWYKINEVLVIFYYGRSGSVFFQSLLDSHPQIIMLPGTYLMYYCHFWEEYGKLSQKELIKQFCGYFAPLFDVTANAKNGKWKNPGIILGFANMGENRTEKLEVNKINFTKILNLLLKKVSEINRKIFFQAIHAAYTITLNRSAQLDYSRSPIIAYQLHNPSFRKKNDILADFKKVKAVHTIREPMQTLGSHFKHSDYNCNILYGSFEMAFPVIHSDYSKAIKLEDLHTKSKPTLEKLTQWLDINWSDSLLESTFNGKKWWNLTDVEQITGFNKIIISKNHNNFYNKFDKYRLTVLYHKRFKLWGYNNKYVSKLECIFLLPLLLLPFKMELIHWKKYLISKRLGGIKYILSDWLYKNGRRTKLIQAWKYSLAKEVREVPLL